MATQGVILFTLAGYPVTLFAAVFGFLWFVYLWETYLDCRQHKIITQTSVVPPELATVVTVDEFAKSKAYVLDKMRFSFIHDAYDMIEATVILWFFVVPWIWNKVTNHALLLNDSIRRYLGIDIGLNSESEILCSLLFLFYVAVYKFFESLPWSLYYNFVIEAKYGFNKQTLSFFLWDRLKSFMVSILIGFPVVAGLIWIIKAGGPYFYIYAYIFTLVITLFLMFIYPEFIAPLFDRYIPLPEGELRRKIEALAEKIEFPLKKLLVVEGSKRSAHSNAYFYGFGKNKRIVLYDTLIRGFKFPQKDGSIPPPSNEADENSRGCAEDEEIVAVLGHELGHWKLNHTILNLIISQVNLFLMFVVFSALMNIDSIYASFGFSGNVPVLLRMLVIFQFLFSPYNTVVAFLMVILSRRLEFQADRFAVNLGYGRFLRSALLVLHKDNLSFPVSDWLYSTFHYSHPPILERIAALDALLKKE